MDEVQFNIALREAISLTDHFTLWRKHVQPSRRRRRRLDLLASGSGNGWPDGRRRYPKIYVREKHGKEISQLISALLDGRAFEGRGVRRDLSNRAVKGLEYSLILISRYPISTEWTEDMAELYEESMRLVGIVWAKPDPYLRQAMMGSGVF